VHRSAILYVYYLLKFFEKQKVIVKSKDGAPSVSIKQLIKALEKELVFH
jgi:hypothetical protein